LKTTSGAKANRPGLNLAMEMARAGDTLVVWRLDSPIRRRFVIVWAGRLIDEICEMMGISKPTLYKYVAEGKVEYLGFRI
jgi:DNA invertase Pin-like site-specific DNA recombinase